MRVLVFAVAIVACRRPATTIEDAGASMEVTSVTGPNVSLLPTARSLPMPKDWPADVPLYAGAHISKIRTHPIGDGGTSRSIEFETPAALDRVIEFYRTAFPSAKKTEDMDVVMVHALQFELPHETIDVTVMSAMDLTQVTVTVSPKR